METINLKTNINCNGCVEAIASHMTNEKGILKWKVDTNSPEKLLTIEATDMIAADIIKVVEKAGFKAEQVDLNTLASHMSQTNA